MTVCVVRAVDASLSVPYYPRASLAIHGAVKCNQGVLFASVCCGPHLSVSDLCPPGPYTYTFSTLVRVMLVRSIMVYVYGLTAYRLQNTEY